METPPCGPPRGPTRHGELCALASGNWPAHRAASSGPQCVSCRATTCPASRRLRIRFRLARFRWVRSETNRRTLPEATRRAISRPPAQRSCV
eukprot:13283305-Alexandrium_andersonii.AAC.1